jgi:hypothetical protein
MDRHLEHFLFRMVSKKDALLTLFFIVGLEYTIREVQPNQEELSE